MQTNRGCPGIRERRVPTVTAAFGYHSPMRDPILYTQAGCDESRRVRDWLTERGIAFTERDVTTDLEAARALLATGTFATPLLVVGTETILGFRPDALTAALSTGEEAGAGRCRSGAAHPGAAPG